MNDVTAQEIAELTAWLRRIIEADADVDPAEVEAYLAAKRDLLARIEATR